MTKKETIDKINILAREFEEDDRKPLSEVLKIVASAIDHEMEKELLITIVKGVIVRGKEIQEELLKAIQEAKERNEAKSN